ncbi:preprotein translocase subunit SecE, partial [candidate division WWE3 bacterium RIFCSPLOWO2_01_FULL_37_15]
YEELKKVQWPNKDQTIRLTLYVIGVSFTVGLIVAGIDYIFSEGLSLALVK